jgi:hypothetical protein
MRLARSDMVGSAMAGADGFWSGGAAWPGGWLGWKRNTWIVIPSCQGRQGPGQRLPGCVVRSRRGWTRRSCGSRTQWWKQGRLDEQVEERVTILLNSKRLGTITLNRPTAN